MWRVLRVTKTRVMDTIRVMDKTRVTDTTRVMGRTRAKDKRVMIVIWPLCMLKGNATSVSSGGTSRQIARREKGKEAAPKGKEKGRVIKAKEKVSRKAERQG